MAKVKTADTIRVSINDFDEYKIKRRSYKEKCQMVDEVAKLMMNNDLVWECYWDTIELVAQEHKLKKKRVLSL